MTDQPEKTPSPGLTARRFVRARDTGILSTQSVDVPGYPFGSVTPYILTPEGAPVLLVSTIAQHTKNMVADGRVCLTVFAQESTDKQASARVTIIGDAYAPDPDELAGVRDRYFAFFPGHTQYFEAHDFVFYAIRPTRVRYIGGFGDIHWVEPEAWAVPQPDWFHAEAGIRAHMNADHADALTNMCRHLYDADEPAPALIALDAEGFHIRGAERMYYVPFAAPVDSVDAVRAEMVRLAQTARDALAAGAAAS